MGVTENRNGIREFHNLGNSENSANLVAFGERFGARGGIRTHVGLRQRILSEAKIDYRELKQDFVAWLQSRGVNWDHYAKCLISKLDKHSRPIGEPMDVVRMFNELQHDSQKRHLVNGLRNLFNFCQAQGLADKQWLDLLRSNLPKTSVGVDLKVPSESEIVEALKRIRDANANPRYFALYNLLLDSGLRVTEAIMLFNGLVSHSVQLERQPGYAVAPLAYFRGTKLAYYGFISDYTLELIAHCTKPISYKKLAGTASKRFKVVSARATKIRLIRTAFCIDSQ